METTILVLAGKRLKVPRLLKRALQVAVSVGLTVLVVFVIQVGDVLLSGEPSSVQTAMSNWVAYVRRPDLRRSLACSSSIGSVTRSASKSAPQLPRSRASAYRRRHRHRYSID